MLARFAGLAGVTLAVALLAAAPQSAPAPAAAAPPGAAPQPLPRSPRNASYTIDARLDPAAHTLIGRQTLTWRNISSVPATTLQFHLYWNAWRDARSSWMRERTRATGLALASRPPEDFGGIDITAASVDGGPDRAGALRFIAPDDGNGDDRTVVELPLEAPVPPGGTVSAEMRWQSRVPRTFARTGRQGDFYFVAHWFPKIGVLEDTGWNTHQFHSATEFFADFGTYDVSLTSPAGWTLGATGVEQARRTEPDGAVTHRYAAADVHDFAWTASPRFVEHRERFEHGTLPAVEMRLLLQPEHAGQAERHFAATRAALRYYGEWFGPYPYGHLTIVDPAWQSGAGGMEYPTIFTAGTRWLAPRHATQPESVTVHEAGHQFWYGIVATNEFEHAWMDEGLNTFSTARTIEAAGLGPNFYTKRYFGGFVPWVFHGLPLSRDVDGNRLHPYRPAARADVPATPTWQYWPGTASAISYNKTALWLHTLERMLGWDTLQRIMATYFERWAFRHPKPEDFFAIANEISGRDLTWFFDQVHRSSHVFDYGVDVFRSVRHGPAFTTTAVVRRYGEGEFPVDVVVRFEDGREERVRWDGRDRWKLFEFTTPARARTAQVDPERVLLLDIDYTNNSASVAPDAPRAARKWSWAWLIWLQDHLLTYGFFV